MPRGRPVRRRVQPVEQARRPPAAASRCRPTSSTSSVSCAPRIQRASPRRRAARACRSRPGTTTTSGDGMSPQRARRPSTREHAVVGPDRARPRARRTSPARRAGATGPRRARSASSAVNRSKMGMAICMVCSSSWCRSGSGSRRARRPAGGGRRGASSPACRSRRRARRRRAGRGRVSRRRAGLLDAHRLDVGRRRHADLAGERARERARAHVRAVGQRADRQVGVGVLGDPGLQVAQRPGAGRLRGELDAELRLAAGPAREQDEPPRDLHAPPRGRGPPRRAPSARSIPAVTPADV